MLIRILAEAKLNRNELIKDLSAVVVKHHCRCEPQLTISGVKEKGKCPLRQIFSTLSSINYTYILSQSVKEGDNGDVIRHVREDRTQPL